MQPEAAKFEKERTLIAGPEDAGTRLDRFLARSLAEYSRTYFAGLIEAGAVRVNGNVEIRGRQSVRAGDLVQISFPAPAPSGVQPEDIPVRILFEDDWLAVVHKPAGMTVHPGAGQKSGTLANALAHHLSRLSQQDPQRPGIVHRLDRDTSGLLVVAKSDRIHHKLSGQFQRREVEKQYLTLVYGAGLAAHGRVEAPIGRHPLQRTRMAVTRRGRPALTLYDIEEQFRDFTYLRVGLKTGRTHQIRVHLAHLNHPVVGDTVYGKGRLQNVRPEAVQTRLRELRRLFLHATLLRFCHPKGGESLQFVAPLPEELETILKFIRDQDRMIE